MIESIDIFEQNMCRYYDLKTDFAGFTIKTNDDGIIQFKISNYSECCEDWGITSNLYDEHEHFIGATIENIQVNYEKYKITLNLTTDQGDITMKMWNYHDGYYPHEIICCYDFMMDGEFMRFQIPYSEM